MLKVMVAPRLAVVYWLMVLSRTWRMDAISFWVFPVAFMKEARYLRIVGMI